jgi:hypothetical protein
MAKATLVRIVKQGEEIINAEITLTQQKKILAAWKELEKYGIGFNTREEEELTRLVRSYGAGDFTYEQVKDTLKDLF